MRYWPILVIVGIVLAGAGAWYVLNSSDQSDVTPTEENSLSATFPADAKELRELKDVFKKNIEDMGGEKAYAQFLAEVDTRDLASHSQAHAFGEALYEVKGIDGLAVCDSSFEFGCYHSLFGVAVQYEGIQKLPEFDEACVQKYGDMNLPCQHGIGHGVLIYTDYDNLVEALELCETIAELPTGGCSSGVFMEYNFHTMDESNPSFIRPLGDDPHEPCGALPERFKASCYFEQVQWWQNVYNKDHAKIGELCGTLDADSFEYRACYNGAGNYIAAVSDMKNEGIIAECALMPNEEATAMCHEGASWLLIPEENGKEKAQELCSVLAEPYKTECLRKLP